MTLISPSTAFVLGTAPCSHSPCSAILRTRSRGRSWRGLPAPREAISGFGGDGLWGLRFADARRGYAFGNGLWETADGGGSWRRASTPQPVVLALAAVADRELVAAMGSCPVGAASCSEHVSLERRAIGSSRWSRVHRGSGIDTATAIAVSGATVWVLAGGRLVRSTDAGVRFTAVPTPCTRPPGLAAGIAVDSAHAHLLCTGAGALGSISKSVYVTSSGGGGWTLAGRPPRAGEVGTITATGGTVLVSSASGASLVHRCVEGGRHWTTALRENDGGLGWADLGFTTARDAVVVRGPAMCDGGGGRPGRLLFSDDGGASWRRARF